MIKKRLIILVIGLPVVVKTLMAFVFGTVAAGVSATVVTVMAQPADPPPGSLEGLVVAIDPGHGGGDGGVTAAGLVEKDLNLEMALVLALAIEERGGRPVLTRDSDVEYAVSNRDELDHRLKIAREHGSHLLLSLHTNSFPDPGQFGAQVFYPPEDNSSKELALFMQDELVRIHPENHREAHVAEFYMLINGNAPSVLVELGFITNAGDRRRLTDEAFQAEMAEAMATAIERYLDTKKPPDGVIHGPPVPEETAVIPAAAGASPVRPGSSGASSPWLR